MRPSQSIPAQTSGAALVILAGLAGAWFAAVCDSLAQTNIAIVSITNVTIRVATANLTSGNFQRYEAAGQRILQGLRPDIIAVQEFNYASTNGAGVNTAAAFRELVHSVFGTNFVYYRENAAGYSLPNGVISRWPIVQSGTWTDIVPSSPNRGFAWTLIDLPGSQDLYVVSAHFLSGAGASARATEAANLRSLMQSNLPATAWMLLGADLNTDARSEAAVTTLRTFLSDVPVPTDAMLGGDADTNEPRSRPYDYVLPNFSFATNQVSVRIGGQSFSNGLVFDSRVFTPLSEVAPVQFGDSGVSGMQHMAVVKDFCISYAVTNWMPVPRPVLQLLSTNRLRWTGWSNLTYTVEQSQTLTNWTVAGTVFSSSTNYFFTNLPPDSNWLFYRVRYP